MTILLFFLGITTMIFYTLFIEKFGYKRGVRDESARPCRKCKERDEASKPSPNNK